ncbi:hypothetical protein THAOC_12683 [Thalassiosira oceanica]|uniref:Uncharacterized protein n=1 Tax=Thalassiosira oceanica TaxID=159749 RepID=K0SJF6_THAOC|nr:hypothetical protein THAOC_12683 [Thalassiosira oceanica]|mmetsp:Transcript_27854/g.62872  ORF Transcript_27854/g.62872 Transcript_27854/m.62872 type:complete len:199 (-) Transcript_27854:123-719(-)|eukprot:EJK66403.1 hypothetical protein THAOC_12683 [Thalassiosira oceanica]
MAFIKTALCATRHSGYGHNLSNLFAHEAMADSLLVASQALIASPSSSGVAGDAVMSAKDIREGFLLGVALALSYSFLNGQSTSSSFVSWPGQRGNDSPRQELNQTVDDRQVFGEWNETKREENYVLYNTRIRERLNTGAGRQRSESTKESKVVIIALMALFFPIFGVETFFALSRLFFCEMGDPSLKGEFVSNMCSPR